MRQRIAVKLSALSMRFELRVLVHLPRPGLRWEVGRRVVLVLRALTRLLCNHRVHTATGHCDVCYRREAPTK